MVITVPVVSKARQPTATSSSFPARGKAKRDRERAGKRETYTREAENGNGKGGGFTGMILRGEAENVGLHGSRPWPCR